MYLDEILTADNFTLAVSRIARDFRERYELPLLHQLGIVIPDIEAAAAELEAKGIGPFFIASGSPVFWNERRQLRDVAVKLGIAYHKGVEIELIEPVENAEFYKNWLDPDGRMVVHHLGFIVNNVDRYAEMIERDGSPTWVRGTIRSFPTTAEFAYMDTVEKAGIIIEFITMKLLGLQVPIPQAVFHALGHVEKAIGIRCIPL